MLSSSLTEGLGGNLRKCVATLALSLALGLGGCGGSSTDAPDNTPATPSKVSFASRADAARFVTQATFGPSASDINAAENTTPQDWLINQINLSPTLHTADTIAFMEGYPEGGDEQWIEAQYPSVSQWSAMFSAPDQLRQRMAFALSQIMVVSAPIGSPNFQDPIGMSYHMDILSEGAFGNYRDLMGKVTHSAVMANYLTFLKNRKENPDTGQVPDENYARELLQLFTIGLYELNLDGTVKTSGGGPIETYTNDDIRGLAKVFTGLSYDTERFYFRRDDLTPDVRRSPLVVFDNYHSTSEKNFLGTTIPAGTTGAESIGLALDAIFEHPNLAPFISKQLIQRFVTSNPKPAYVERVARTFERGYFQFSDGTIVGESVRGDLAATIAAILMDNEARSATAANANDFGKVREPVLRLTHWVRAFNAQTRNAYDEYSLYDTSTARNLSQHPYRSPSVFNFYRPGYVSPGSNSGEAGLVAPEMQLINEFSFVSAVNYLSHFIRDQTSDDTGRTPSFRPDYSAEMSLANDVVALVDRLEDILVPGGLESETRSRIEAVLAEIPVQIDAGTSPEQSAEIEERDRRTRVEVGVLMIMTAAEYVVQR